MRSALEWAEAKAMAADGVSKSEIARRLGINWRTAAKLVEAVEPPRYSRAPAGSMLDPLEPVMRRLLEDWPEIKAPRVTEILRDEYGYGGSVDLVRKRLAQLRPRPERPAQRTGYRPGQVLQVDWAEMPTRPRIAGRERRVYALICSLPFSGAATAHFTFDMTIESFLEGHVRAFEWLGGVPRECVYDNLRSAVARRERVDGRDVIHWNPRFSQLRGHYAFHAHACTPETPREKGSVEGAVRHHKTGFWPARRFADLAELDDVYAGLARSGRVAAPPCDRPARRRRAARARARAAAAAAADRLRRRRPAVLAGPARRLSEVRPLLLPRAGGAGSSARRAALGPRPRLDRAPRPARSPATRAATSTAIWQPAPRMRPEPPPVAALIRAAGPRGRPGRAQRLRRALRMSPKPSRHQRSGSGCPTCSPSSRRHGSSSGSSRPPPRRARRAGPTSSSSRSCSRPRCSRATRPASRNRIRHAAFPAHKTLEDFDFTAQPAAEKPLIFHLAQLAWASRAHERLLLRPARSWFTLPSSRFVIGQTVQAVPPDTWILSPLRRPWVTWTAASSPRWTLCNTVWRATPSAWAASASGTKPSGMSGTKRARISSVRRIRQGACGVVCSPGSSPSRSQRRIVAVETPSSSAACVDREQARWRGRAAAAAGMPCALADARTRGSVNGRPVPVRRPWRLRIAAIWRSG